MPDGERVTTGSESRRTWELEGYPPYDGFFHRVAGPKLGASEKVRVVEVVESGHDEQTEDRWTLEGPKAVGIDVNKMAQTLERTEAALRDLLAATADIHLLAFHDPDAEHPLFAKEDFERFLAARDRAETVIEERFKPSAPGGDDG